MGNIKIIKGVFDTKLELEHAGVAAGFPSPADEYRHETLDSRAGKAGRGRYADDADTGTQHGLDDQETECY